MSEITYVRGDATVPSVKGVKVIAHVCNDFGLGAAQFVRVEPYMWVANMVGQRGIRTGSKGVPVRYEAIDAALGRLAQKPTELGASVHMPRIGCGLAGGAWARVEPLITERLVRRGISVTVYDHGEGRS
ncbi:Appr-1-p processing protein [Streptomyces sp. NBC_00452]|uniref:Appr-1-p processing protein n=1 Tax=Streptomyces sp. NBC_00452 TaxID=2975746 RepID=UPI00224EFF75|nr:Appr-1-p processing protein [Streptomyces sp. NBC_00452]MCX5062849.1 Appr-1-p processing protein [Streptomyces sp. NBC_00452]